MDVRTDIDPCMPRRRETAVVWRSTRRPTPRRGSASFPREHVEIFKKTSCITGLKRAGRDVAPDMLEVAGIPSLLTLSLDHELPHGAFVVTAGRSGVESSKTVMWKPHQDVVDSHVTCTGDAAGFRGWSVLPATARGHERVFNIKLTDKESTASPSKAAWRATNHTSGTMWNDARRAGAATGSAACAGRVHEKQCYADI